jgi:hypothetical protein
MPDQDRWPHTCLPGSLAAPAALAALLAALAALPSCGGGDSSGDGGNDTPVDGDTTTSLEQYGVTWTFQGPVRYGQFANGDWWVLGPVTIIAIAPAFDGTHHGWEVNPADPVAQGFDTRVADFDAARVPALPYTATGGQSIVKSASLEPLDDVDCRPCLRTAAVLTVLDAVPPNEGATVFRPPYFGAAKPLRPLDELHPELLPSLASVPSAPALADAVGDFRRVQLDHKTNWTGRAMHPAENSPDYGSDISSRNAEGALRLMLDEPSADKRELLVHYVQYGLDLYAMLGGGVTWPPNGGHSEGRKLPIAFAGLLLGDTAMQDAVRNSTAAQFGENGGMYDAAAAGTALYGQAEDEEGYWRNVVFDTGSRTLRDPYGMIDGGQRPGDSYQFCCTSMVWKSTATALRLMPELIPIWGYDPFLEYVDRWVAQGAWTQPDPCAPPDGVCAGGDVPGTACTSADERTVCTGTDAVCDLAGTWDAHYGITFGPDGSGGCIADTDPTDGTGRFPDRHGDATDDGYYQSAFANELWDAHVAP